MSNVNNLKTHAQPTVCAVTIHWIGAASDQTQAFSLRSPEPIKDRIDTRFLTNGFDGAESNVSPEPYRDVVAPRAFAMSAVQARASMCMSGTPIFRSFHLVREWGERLFATTCKAVAHGY